MNLKNKNRQYYFIFLLVLLVFFLIRIYLSKYLTLYSDLNTFIRWGRRLSEVGFADFYSTYWCDYMPVYLYVLRFLNYLSSSFPEISNEIIYKLPANIADVIISVLILLSLKKYISLRKSVFFALLYFLNPAVLANSTFWGQIESFHALPIVGSSFFALKQKHFLSGLFFTIAFLTKPQAIIVLPIIVLANFFPYIRRFDKKEIFQVVGSFITSIGIASFILSLPFIYPELYGLKDLVLVPANFIFERFQGSYGQYEYASLNAFNFWGIFAMWESDQTLFLKFSYQSWGMIIFFGFYAIIFGFLLNYYYKNTTNGYESKYLIIFESISLLFLITFLFLTRVHERHLFTAIVFSSFLIYKSKTFLYYYLLISLVYVLNLIYAYVRLTTKYKEFSQSYFIPIIFILSTLLILILIYFLIDFIRTASNSEKFKKLITNSLVKFKQCFLYKNFTTIALISLFIISFGLKVDDLGKPARYYFDELFFTFTSQEMAKGNPQGWEKGERAPGEVEFEWTHPPLGKELSALGIIALGDNPFAWRISQAVFGALGTVFIFFLATALFESKRIGIFASFLYTFESLFFVISRIGMVDIFLLNFILLSSLFFVKYIKNNRFIWITLSALFCGAAMSIKWTGVLAPTLFCGLSILWIFYLKFYKDLSLRIFYVSIVKVVAIFLLVPLLVYVTTYIPFFLNGNSFSDLISLQESMYNYHINVTKLHTYRSEWWSWPLLIRPICLYIEKLGLHREYIYALGNPTIWWSGVLILIFSVMYSIKKKYVPLIFVVICYFAFMLPWAVSPRKITYIYHYLPSLLFLLLIISFFLDKIWSFSLKAKLFVVYFLVCVAITFMFFYPILSAQKIPKKSLKHYRWMKKNWTYIVPDKSSYEQVKYS